MPFDGKISAEKFSENFLGKMPGAASAGHLRLARLVDDLRRPLPLHWDFSVVLGSGHCGTAGCALGVEMELRGIGYRVWNEYFDVPVRVIAELFLPTSYLTEHETTPFAVAARIEGWLRDRYDV